MGDKKEPKFIQITSSVETVGFGPQVRTVLFALDEEGNVYRKYFERGEERSGWMRVTR